MRAHLDDAYELGEPLAALWASEAASTGGSATASPRSQGGIDVELNHAALRAPAPAAAIRLVTREEALELFPPIHDEVRPRRCPACSSARGEWWEIRRLADGETQRRGGPAS